MSLRQVGPLLTGGAPETAVITGASSGIGKIYADRLAGRGYDLILIARGREKLEAVAEDLRSRHGCRVDAMVADLVDPAELDAVARSIAGKEDITLLINNAGSLAGGPLASADWADLEALTRLNILAHSRLALAVLPRFKASDRGTIVNIGSAAAFYTSPTTAFYAATKAFVLVFTRGLQAEFAHTGVMIQLVAPPATESGIWEASGFPSPATVMSTEACVDAALRGLEFGEAITVPSLDDLELLAQNEQAGSELLRSAQSTGRAAERYALQAA